VVAATSELVEDLIMRDKLFASFMMACAAVTVLQPHQSCGRPPRTTTKCLQPGSSRPVACLAFSADTPGEAYELWTLDATTGVHAISLGDDDDDGLIASPIVPDTAAGNKPADGGYFWFFEPSSAGFFEEHRGSTADLPAFQKPDGTPLLVQYRETDLGFILGLPRVFADGEVLSVRGGIADGWPGATIMEMPATFPPEELFARDPARFPLYTGDAVVADVALMRVIPEPATVVLLFGVLIPISKMRRR
jgi:hypothetical protein